MLTPDTPDGFNIVDREDVVGRSLILSTPDTPDRFTIVVCEGVIECPETPVVILTVLRRGVVIGLERPLSLIFLTLDTLGGFKIVVWADAIERSGTLEVTLVVP